MKDRYFNIVIFNIVVILCQPIDFFVRGADIYLQMLLYLLTLVFEREFFQVLYA